MFLENESWRLFRLIPEIPLAFDNDSQPLNEIVIGNAEKFVREFLWFATAIVHAKDRDLKRELV